MTNMSGKKTKMKKVVVNDYLQKKYTYVLTAPRGKKFHPDFKPEVTPKQMLELGVFGGAYFDEIPKEFPKSWFTHAKISKWHEDPSLNYYKVKASLSRSVWEEKGWIHKDDPRGWFQWYCRYYMGRRHVDDERQIKRWKAIVRHVAALKKHCKNKPLCRPKQRQTLLHWAYDPRKI